MSVFLILLAPILAFTALSLRYKTKFDWRLLFLFSAASMGVMITAVTEILSLFAHFEKTYLTAAWVLIDTGLLVQIIIHLEFSLSSSRAVEGPLDFPPGWGAR